MGIGWDGGDGYKMKCEGVCGARDKLLFPKMVDGKRFMMCQDCIKMVDKIGKEIDSQIDEHCNEYVVKWKLRDKGRTWIEEHENMTLSDFEVVYGANPYEIVWVTLRQSREAIL